ncbi:MAG: sugar phosphate nucleotidyltransferase [Gemmataceae bacterium]|nr:sugar phosphate nucleotidyltransferase [Gemmataceae bacterium]MDW8243351.1 mannose-1-phosphate guanylyltransferase [Thermogemmata sp.]
MELQAMIMAGGGGTRFWPRSRRSCPKQFLRFRGERTLLQETVERLTAQVSPERLWVITAQAHLPLAVEQLAGLVPPEQIIGEPYGRDTAPCVGLGAALIARRHPQAAVLVLPADHIIEPVQEFRRALHAAVQFLHDWPDYLITFGIRPSYPATGYGYIRRGQSIGSRQQVYASHVLEFCEKPDFNTAERFVASGEYFWNSGIFLWRAETILQELSRRRPTLYAVVKRIAEFWDTPQRDSVFQQAYATADKISVDYAIMQDAGREGRVLVVHAPFQWDDVGSWLALERHNPQDAAGNTVQGRHCGVDTHNCVIVGDPDHLIATLGVRDLVIVQCGSATLVTTRQKEAEVKKLVETLQNQGWEQYL